jgi:arginyl-tRNA synthetase
MNLAQLIKDRFAPALASLVSDPAPLLDMIRPAQDEKFGDFQANFAMPLAKQLGRPPRDIAQAVVHQLQIADLCEPPEIAGPGFINLRLRTDVLASRISRIAGDDRLGLEPTTTPRTVVVDFSSPNVAKPMHVGHVRSTVIGDAICRVLRFAGHSVISDNHVGDWGTQFGMIIYGYRHFRDDQAFGRDAVSELARLYKLVNKLTDYQTLVTKRPQLVAAAGQFRQQLATASATGDAAQKQTSALRKQLQAADEALKDADATIAAVETDEFLRRASAAHPNIGRLARDETAKLHAGDPANQQLWNQFLPACLAALDQVYQRMNIRFDLTLGESFYNPQLADVVRELRESGLAVDSEGAVCVFLEEGRAPFIVRKSDGAFTYATTDLATIRYRVETLHANEIVYVVDSRQSEHFQQLFGTARRWKYGSVPMTHVSFGTVMGRDGKPYKTRAGDTVGLESLLDEAVTRARQIVDDNDNAREQPILSEADRVRVATIVGIGGLKYADLHHNRESDYIFDWDKMLALTGDTAAYMQYAYARICGIFRKLQLDRALFASAAAAAAQAGDSAVLLTGPEERRLALHLLRFDEAIAGVLQDYRPHILTTWLFDTADAFSRFYDRCSVQEADTPELRHSRLILCDLMARGLRTGLSLLGIETAEVM